MKIVAIIPARKNSKGIPNKNIRLLNGKPLIWYTLQNAKSSTYITDIVVTTDSPEIEIIGKQMGVKVKVRDSELCGDDVTLDAVIYDAVEQIDYDYVVTLQPTSPTLKVKTLDKAIAYTIENQLDTCISAVNRPHLAWKLEEGKKIPAYEKRLNRQYLPPSYQETGAFVISKRDVVTKNNRIGKRVDVYELPEEETIDIDSFTDLRLAENLMTMKKVAIYVNGNNLRGVGHVYRALELADEFDCKPDIYYDVNQTERSVFGETMHSLIGINGIQELMERLKERQYDILINDILSTSIDYMIAVRKCLPKGKIVNFEDDGEGIYKADLVINALYLNSQLPNVKCGEDYYISSKLFMFYQPIIVKEKVKHVFISFGGADPQNYSDRLLAMIKEKEYKEIEFTVVLGRAKKNVELLLEYNRYTNIQVLYDVSNMPELMAKCDVGITSRGRTGYELSLLGIPMFVMAQNEREARHGFMCDENGYTYLGIDPGDHMIQSHLNMFLQMTKEERAQIQAKLLSHDLRNGRKRVMTLIGEL